MGWNFLWGPQFFHNLMQVGCNPECYHHLVNQQIHNWPQFDYIMQQQKFKKPVLKDFQRETQMVYTRLPQVEAVGWKAKLRVLVRWFVLILLLCVWVPKFPSLVQQHFDINSTEDVNKLLEFIVLPGFLAALESVFLKFIDRCCLLGRSACCMCTDFEVSREYEKDEMLYTALTGYH